MSFVGDHVGEHQDGSVPRVTGPLHTGRECYRCVLSCNQKINKIVRYYFDITYLQYIQYFMHEECYVKYTLNIFSIRVVHVTFCSVSCDDSEQCIFHTCTELSNYQ